MLYELAIRPEIAEVLREEIASSFGRYGPTRVAYSQMTKLDSFIKESMRLTGIGLREQRPLYFTSQPNHPLRQ